MATGTFRLTPVAEMQSRPEAFLWAPQRDDRHWVPLGPDTPDDDVARVLSWLPSRSEESVDGSLSAVLERLGKTHRLMLAGGLQPSDDQVTIYLGYCADLEDWRQWRGLKSGALGPWLGHSPDPGVGCKQDEAFIWADMEANPEQWDRQPMSIDRPRTFVRKSAPPPDIRVSYAEIATAVAEAAKDLAGFRDRLRDWLKIHAPEHVGFADHFAEKFAIDG